MREILAFHDSELVRVVLPDAAIEYPGLGTATYAWIAEPKCPKEGVSA